jgi:hypothetical protein
MMVAEHVRNALLAAIAAFAFSQPVWASTDGAAKDEIDHLLNFVGTSSCTFVRNGTEYPAEKAREHLAGKYEFAGARISTAEQFIEHLATGSSMSGQPYHVKCGKTDALTGVWLANELARYRKLQHVQTVRTTK